MDAAVDIFYRKILTDSILAPFFSDMDMDRQIKKQKAFLTMAFGGPNKYNGKTMRLAHAKMVKEQGLSDVHFDAVARHLKESLEELSVPAHLIEAVMQIAAGTRQDVLNR